MSARVIWGESWKATEKPQQEVKLMTLYNYGWFKLKYSQRPSSQAAYCNNLRIAMSCDVQWYMLLSYRTATSISLWKHKILRSVHVQYRILKHQISSLDNSSFRDIESHSVQDNNLLKLPKPRAKLPNLLTSYYFFLLPFSICSSDSKLSPLSTAFERV